jgi:hypothetical protein
MKTTCQSFQMITHRLFISIDSNYEKSREIRMRVIAGKNIQMREILYSGAGVDRQAGDFRNFVVCAGESRTKREGWQVWFRNSLCNIQ